MIGVDTSFLVAFELGTHPLHERARRIAADYAGESFAVAPQVTAEFIHVVTDPRRFEKPLPMAEALGRSGKWWTASETVQVTPDASALSLFHEWMAEFRLARRRILDTMLAATYRTAGISVIVSSNWRDFAIFPGLHPVLLE